MAENRCATRLARVSRRTALAVAVLGVAAASSAVAVAAPVGAASAGRPHLAAVVPWSKAGPGWAVAEYSATSLNPAVKGATTLYLISPQGAKYLFYTWPASYSGPLYSLADWSGDRQRVLVATLPAGEAPTHLEQISLATGKIVAKFTLPAGITSLGYTKPSGLNLLALRQRTSSTQVVRYDLTGKQQIVLTSGRGLTGAIDSPDGTSVIVGTTSGLEQVANSGGNVKRLPAPVPVTGCDPVRWWSASTVLAWCSAKGVRYYFRLWLFPVGGGKVTPLTPQREGHGPDYGDLAAWRLSTGRLYLQANLGQCGPDFIGWQWRDGTLHPVTVPGTQNENQIVTGFGQRLLIRTVGKCPAGSLLLWFDPMTSAVQYVLRASAKVLGVVAVVPFGRPSTS